MASGFGLNQCCHQIGKMGWFMILDFKSLTLLKKVVPHVMMEVGNLISFFFFSSSS